jgi:pilus assembly protein CpaB
MDALSERWWGLPVRVRTLAVAAAGILLAVVVLADLGRSPHGPPVAVTVAAGDLPAGHRLGPGDLVRRRWPRDLAPADGVGTDTSGTLLGPVSEGAPVTTAMVGDGGLAALAADGHAVVSLPAGLLPGPGPGARLDLIAPDVHGGTRVLATHVRVLTTDETHVHVEVHAADAAEVAAAGRREDLVAVLRAP